MQSVDWETAPQDAQYYHEGNFYKKTEGDYWYIYWPNHGWEFTGHSSPENYSWWSSVIPRPAAPSPLWLASELIEKIRFQMLTCGTGSIVYNAQLDSLEELIDEIYMEGCK